MSNETIRDHIQIIMEEIDSLRRGEPSDDWPLERFIIKRNWERADKRMTTVNDIFDEYDTAYRNGEAVRWHSLEVELKRELSFSYGTVKDLIKALWDSHKWKRVCYEYAKEHRCAEFHYIIESDIDNDDRA